MKDGNQIWRLYHFLFPMSPIMKTLPSMGRGKLGKRVYRKNVPVFLEEIGAPETRAHRVKWGQSAIVIAEGVKGNLLAMR